MAQRFVDSQRVGKFGVRHCDVFGLLVDQKFLAPSCRCGSGVLMCFDHVAKFGGGVVIEAPMSRDCGLGFWCSAPLGVVGAFRFGLQISAANVAVAAMVVGCIGLAETTAVMGGILRSSQSRNRW